MGELLDIYEPEANPCDAQAKRNQELDADSLDHLLRNMKAAYDETLPMAAEYWQRQGSKGVSQLMRFAAWKTAVLTILGDDVPDEHKWLVDAGASLVPNADGTVTVKG